MKKEFVFSAKFDTSEFDRSVEQMQKKLKDIMAPGDMMRMQRDTAQRMQNSGQGGIMSAPSMEAFTKATQASRREMDQMIAEQARGQEKLGKMLAQRTETLKKLQDQQKQVVKDSKEELEIKEKIARVESNNQQLKETYRQRDASLNQAMDARDAMKPQGMERVAQAYQHGGVRGAATAGMRMLSPTGMMGLAGAGMGFLGQGLQMGGEFYRDLTRAPVRTESAMGSAVSGSLGKQTSDIYGRRSSFEQMFAPERQRAAQQALDANQASKTSDLMGLGGGLLKAGGMGLAGAAAGAGVGSIVPGIGTAVGGIVGGIGGFGKGMWDMASNERMRSQALSPFSNTQSQRYQSILAEDMVKNYESSYESQKKQNPFKTAAVGEYEQNYQRNLDQQRSMGLNNEGFYGPGGFQQNAINQGFTPEMGMQMSSGILGAGGSTRMARDSAFGLQAQRGMDLTNASQVLGTLSGGLGSSGASEQATIKILSEGMKLGLDDSKFAEENRRFVAMTAEIVAKSGATSGDDFTRTAGGFGKFVGENTNAGIGAAKTAYDQYQQISQSTTGPRGVMRAAGFMSDPALSKLSTMSKQALMQVPESDLNEDNPLVQNAAKEAGVSAKDIVSRVTNTNQGSVSRFKQADQLRDKLRSYAKSVGKENLSKEDIDKAPENVKNDFNQLTAYQTTELGYQGSRETTARALGTVNTGVTDAGKATAREGAIGEKLGSGDRTGRMEDTTIKAMAADSKVVLDNFNEMAPAMKSAAASTAAWTREVREANAALQSALESARANKNSDTLKTVEDLMKKLSNGAGEVQGQGGRSSK